MKEVPLPLPGEVPLKMVNETILRTEAEIEEVGMVLDDDQVGVVLRLPSGSVAKIPLVINQARAAAANLYEIVEIVIRVKE